MNTISTYPENVETHMYWNLLKDLNDKVKIQLFIKLKNSLLTKEKPSADDNAQQAYFSILEKLKVYQSYTKGWDGAEASPLTEKVVANFSHLLEVVDKELLKDLTIYPETNGTLLIDSTKREAGINLGDDNFSYYMIDEDQVSGQNSIPFSVAAITKVLSHINQ